MVLTAKGITIPLLYSDTFLEHDTGLLHPERAGRLTAVVNALNAMPWNDRLDWITPTLRGGLEARVGQFQSPAYVEAVKALAERGGGQIDADTVVSARSYEVALLALSAWLDGVDIVLERENASFVLARPPGHHATRRSGMGFCLFSNAAIAAHYALEQPGVERVAILDWDVHHGNGTQDIVENNAAIAYCSLHQEHFYPGTGRAEERGDHGNVLNLPMAAGSSLEQYLPVFDHHVMPFLRQFKPDLLIVSAGYDATQADQLAGMALQPRDYAVFTQRCLGLTRRILFGLEGGYDFEALGQAVVETLGAIVSAG